MSPRDFLNREHPSHLTTPRGVTLWRAEHRDALAPEVPPAWWYEGKIGAVLVAIQPALDDSPGVLWEAWIGDRSSVDAEEEFRFVRDALAWLDARLVETRDALLKALPVSEEDRC